MISVVVAILLNYLKVSVKVIVKRNIVRKFVVLTNKIKNYGQRNCEKI